MRTVILLMSLCSCLMTVEAQESGDAKNVSIDFNFYPYLSDLKNDTDVTISINAQLPGRFSYFSFNSFGDVISADSKNFRFAEHSFRWQPSAELPLDFVTQFTTIAGNGNDRVQAGVRWRLHETGFLKSFFEKINVMHTITFYAKRWDESDDDIWQMEHLFIMRFPYISDRLYLLTWLDHTFDLDPRPGVPKNPIHTESQLGVRLIGNLYATAEYRINEFRRSDVNNLAIGFEIKTRW